MSLLVTSVSIELVTRGSLSKDVLRVPDLASAAIPTGSNLQREFLRDRREMVFHFAVQNGRSWHFPDVAACPT
jgi:hypothetical protein